MANGDRAMPVVLSVFHIELKYLYRQNNVNMEIILCGIIITHQGLRIYTDHSSLILRLLHQMIATRDYQRSHYNSK